MSINRNEQCEQQVYNVHDVDDYDVVSLHLYRCSIRPLLPSSMPSLLYSRDQIPCLDCSSGTYFCWWCVCSNYDRYAFTSDGNGNKRTEIKQIHDKCDQRNRIKTRIMNQATEDGRYS